MGSCCGCGELSFLSSSRRDRCQPNTSSVNRVRRPQRLRPFPPMGFRRRRTLLEGGTPARPPDGEGWRQTGDTGRFWPSTSGREGEGYPSAGVCALLAIPGIGAAGYRGFGQGLPGTRTAPTGNQDRKHRGFGPENRRKSPVSGPIQEYNLKPCLRLKTTTRGTGCCCFS